MRRKRKTKNDPETLTRIIEELQGIRKPRPVKKTKRLYSGYVGYKRSQTEFFELRLLQLFALDRGADLSGLLLDDRYLKRR